MMKQKYNTSPDAAIAAELNPTQPVVEQRSGEPIAVTRRRSKLPAQFRYRDLVLQSIKRVNRRAKD